MDLSLISSSIPNKRQKLGHPDDNYTLFNKSGSSTEKLNNKTRQEFSLSGFFTNNVHQAPNSNNRSSLALSTQSTGLGYLSTGSIPQTLLKSSFDSNLLDPSNLSSYSCPSLKFGSTSSSRSPSKSAEAIESTKGCSQKNSPLIETN